MMMWIEEKRECEQPSRPPGSQLTNGLIEDRRSGFRIAPGDIARTSCRPRSTIYDNLIFGILTGCRNSLYMSLRTSKLLPWKRMMLKVAFKGLGFNSMRYLSSVSFWSR